MAFIYCMCFVLCAVGWWCGGYTGGLHSDFMFEVEAFVVVANNMLRYVRFVCVCVGVFLFMFAGNLCGVCVKLSVH